MICGPNKVRRHVAAYAESGRGRGGLMQTGKWLATLLLATSALALGGCGGGFVSIGVGTTFVDDASPFIFWAGSSNEDRVVDVNNKAFAFYSDNGCLYDFQTDRENRGFCLNSNADTAQYGSLMVRIANIRAANGTCIAALIDPVTLHFIDIELDAMGREVVFSSPLLPQFCVT
jgi:hypothetical protein